MENLSYAEGCVCERLGPMCVSVGGALRVASRARRKFHACIIVEHATHVAHGATGGGIRTDCQLDMSKL